MYPIRSFIIGPVLFHHPGVQVIDIVLEEGCAARVQTSEEVVMAIRSTEAIRASTILGAIDLSHSMPSSAHPD